MPSSIIQVLAVDDERDLCALTKQFLEMSKDFFVDTANSVQEALAKLSANHFDAIVSDYQMPGEDGIHFLKSLRSIGDRTPFILFTGKGREEVIIEALNNGADSYLQKGFDPVSQYAELRHRIQSLVGRHQAEEALRSNESKLQRAEEVAGFGHWQIDLEAGTITGSRGAVSICGLEKSTLSFDDWQKIPLPEYRSFLDRSMKDLIEQGKPYDVDAKICRPTDGKIIDVQSLAQYDRDKRMVFGVLKDITERKRSEEAIRQKQMQLQVAMDMANLGQWEYDVANDTFTFDDHFYALFATTAEREGGTKMRSSEYAKRFLPPNSAPIVGHEIEVALSTKDPDFLRRIDHDIIVPKSSMETLSCKQ